MRSVMKRLTLVGLLAVALLIGAAGARSQPINSPLAAAAGPPDQFVLRLKDVTKIPSTVDSVAALDGDLLDVTDQTKKVGEAGGVCGVVRIDVGPPPVPTLMCHGIFRLYGQGDLYMAALWSVLATYPYTFRSVIADGTDAYFGALGRADFTAMQLGTYVVKLTWAPGAHPPSPGTVR
jgi:hypothetical protein